MRGLVSCRVQNTARFVNAAVLWVVNINFKNTDYTAKVNADDRQAKQASEQAAVRAGILDLKCMLHALLSVC